MACSTPPMYCSIGNQRAIAAVSKGALSQCGDTYRKKYQEESTNVSMVSVSRSAAVPHFGHVTFRNAALLRNGDSPVPVILTSSGSTTGNCASGTGTMPHEGQWIIGIGVPQYRWRDTPQSFKR